MTVARRSTFAVGDTFAAFDAAFHAWLLACGMNRNGDLSDAYADSSPGGVRRFGVLSNVVAGGSSKFYTIDTSIDWRDRILRVSFMSVDGSPATAMFPGANVNDKRFALCAGIGGAGHQLYWTGPGVALPQAAASGRSMRPTTTDGALVVRSSDGSLCWETFAADTNTPRGVMVLIEGSERLGVSTSPSPLAVPVAVDTEEVRPEQLNELQDAGVLSQVRGNAPIAGATPFAQVKMSEAFPLGPIVYGDPPVPVRAFRKLLGEVNYDLSYEARQTIGATGILRRWSKTGALAAGAYAVVDDSADWRDRMLVATLRVTAADESPGAVASAFSATGAYQGACYTGLGEDPTAAAGSPAWRARTNTVNPNLSIFATVTDGKLVIKNEGTGTYYACGLIEASFPLGPRSVKRIT